MCFFFLGGGGFELYTSLLETLGGASWATRLLANPCAFFMMLVSKCIIMMLITLYQSSTWTSDFFNEFLYDADLVDFQRWVKCGVLLNSQGIIS